MRPTKKQKDYSLIFQMLRQAYHAKLQLVVYWYITILIVIFPVWATDRYFHILGDRYQFFWKSTCCVSVVILLITIWYLLRYLKNRSDLGLSMTDEPAISPIRFLKQTINNLSVADRCLLVFLSVMALSTLLSEWPQEAFWGTSGRYQGMFLWIYYALCYFIISRYSDSWRQHFRLFVLVGAVLSAWGITDYMNLDLFHWVAAIKQGQRGMFMSSFGNINTYTSIIAVYAAVSSTLFVTDQSSSKWSVVYAVCFFLNITALITGQSDNAVIGIVVLLYFLPFCIRNSRLEMVRLLFLIECLFLSFMGVKLLTTYFPNPYIGLDNGILLRMCGKKVWYLAFAIVWIPVLVLMKIKETKRMQTAGYVIRIIWGLMGILGTIGIFMILWDVNHNGTCSWYEPYKKWLLLSDEWGTHRGGVWRIALEHIKSFPLLTKLIGTGPETFGILLNRDNYQEMLSMCGQIFDSPHNEALQYLFTTGILGFISYYGFLLLRPFCIMMEKKKDPMKSAAALGIVTYVAVSVVNISVSITFPYLILLTAFVNQKERRKTETDKSFCQKT